MNATEHIDWFNHLGREARYDLVSIAAIMIITNTFQVIYPFMMLFGVYIFAKYFGKVIFHAFNSINDWNVERKTKEKIKKINIGAEIRPMKDSFAALHIVNGVPSHIGLSKNLNGDHQIINSITHEVFHFWLLREESWSAMTAFDKIDGLYRGITSESYDGKLGEEVNG